MISLVSLTSLAQDTIRIPQSEIDEIISTRRLVHIIEAYSIFKDKMKSIEMCTNRFDDDTKASFLDLYTKVDAGEDVTNYGQEEIIEQDSNDNEEVVDNTNY